MKKTRKSREGYRETLEGYRKELRRDRTGAEKIYGVYVASRVGVEYVEQEIVYVRSGRGYIVDFYYPSKKLVVELDGYRHSSEEGGRKDKKRDADLLAEGIRTLRVRNMDLWMYPDTVLDRTREALRGEVVESVRAQSLGELVNRGVQKKARLVKKVVTQTGERYVPNLRRSRLDDAIWKDDYDDRYNEERLNMIAEEIRNEL